jgi:hypothetical protein
LSQSNRCAVGLGKKRYVVTRSGIGGHRRQYVSVDARNQFGLSERNRRGISFDDRTHAIAIGSELSL